MPGCPASFGFFGNAGPPGDTAAGRLSIDADYGVPPIVASNAEIVSISFAEARTISTPMAGL